MYKQVFMEHDGAVDDLLSQLLLMTMEDTELLGVNVTPADCYLEPGLESTYKLLQVMGKAHIPIGRGTFNGVNTFPNEWRARPEVINVLPALINLPAAPDPYSHPEAVDLLLEKLRTATQKVTILITGPCSNLVFALKKQPELAQKIEQVVWMGGAFRTQGNVQTYQHNGTAEWNVFWDPIRSQELLAYNLPIVFIPLDVTNHVPVNKDFLSRLARQSNHQLSNLAGQFWALTIDTIPSYHYVYYMWDVLATSYLGIPGEFTTEEVKINISTRPPNAGQTMITAEGTSVRIVTDVNKEVFYEYVLNQFKR